MIEGKDVQRNLKALKLYEDIALFSSAELNEVENYIKFVISKRDQK